MGELSRRSSRQPLVRPDSRHLTSFPDPNTSKSSPENDGHNAPLFSLLNHSEPSMFDENNAEMATDPQSLSAAPADVVQNIIDHHGAILLTRRLATLLAERDAHITALTRLAEEYDIPEDRIIQTASRVKQAEQRRLALSTAADEDLAPSVPSDSGDSTNTSTNTNTIPGALDNTIGKLTRLFAGGTIRRQDAAKAASSPTGSTSRVDSTDTQSIRSTHTAHSVESGPGWTASLFSNHNKRHDSQSSSREPVELVTQHDKDLLPPTLADRTQDLQDPQEAHWNQYLLKLMSTRTQRGNNDQADGIGMIGASQFGQEGAAGQRKMHRLIELVIGGIPMARRHNVWMELSNADNIRVPGTYIHFLRMRDQVDHSEIEAIAKDVPRTLTSVHQYYADKGDKRLKEVLIAFVSKYPDLGYTQGLNTIAGYLCLTIADDEQAFWMLCNIVENFFPEAYFSRTTAMVGPLADSVVLRSYVKELHPALAKHMDDLDISPAHTVPLSWFFTAFTSALPASVVMRVWDIWLCLPKQKTFLFGVALAVLMQNAAGLMECVDEAEYCDYLGNKCKFDGETKWVNELMVQAISLHKKLEHVEERRTLEAKRLLKKSDSTEALYRYNPEEV